MSYNMVILNVQDAIKWRTHEGPDSRSVLCPNGHSSVFICVGIPLWYCSMMSTLTETDKFWISELRIKKKSAHRFCQLSQQFWGNGSVSFGLAHQTFPSAFDSDMRHFSFLLNWNRAMETFPSTECSTWKWCLLEAKQERLHRIHMRCQIPLVLLSMY